jgi:hypothetical protein
MLDHKRFGRGEEKTFAKEAEFAIFTTNKNSSQKSMVQMAMITPALRY